MDIELNTFLRYNLLMICLILKIFLCFRVPDFCCSNSHWFGRRTWLMIFLVLVLLGGTEVKPSNMQWYLQITSNKGRQKNIYLEIQIAYFSMFMRFGIYINSTEIQHCLYFRFLWSTHFPLSWRSCKNDYCKCFILS